MTRLRIATLLDTELSSEQWKESTSSICCWSAKMAESEGGTKEKDGGKKKQKKGFLKAPQIFQAPKTTVVADSGALVPHHRSQRSNQTSSLQPLGKENHIPPELLKIPWRKMEQDDPWGEKVSFSASVI